jgi:hypothetical protein
VAAPAATSAVNKWIIGEVVETVASLDKAMAELRFDAAPMRSIALSTTASATGTSN